MMGTNVDVTRGIANETVTKLYDIILAPDAQIRIANVENGNQCHAVYATEVTSAIFKHSSPLQREVTSFATLPVKVTQFPCVSALVLTGHKIQGRTLDAVILGALSRIHKTGHSGWIYVILSRVRTVNNLFLLTPLEEDLKKYKPRTDVMTEMNRLRLIEIATLARLESD
ncbi:hypothetical protein OUZ56_005507 [Daphnia magna]|uniref:Uncharacterized protein n=1 Tax=Daphnia magna TaxID=35525 RepID=A0ABQ9YSZ1_9CRUS|nr:hypothetical protein OUZ56_005507 [Daphnia magna]